jgi:hypothetical protein
VVGWVGVSPAVAPPVLVVEGLNSLIATSRAPSLNIGSSFGTGLSIPLHFAMSAFSFFNYFAFGTKILVIKK